MGHLLADGQQAAFDLESVVPCARGSASSRSYCSASRLRSTKLPKARAPDEEVLLDVADVAFVLPLVWTRAARQARGRNRSGPRSPQSVDETSPRAGGDVR